MSKIMKGVERVKGQIKKSNPLPGLTALMKAAKKGAKASRKGEGSRGGHVIGHTRSGKPIYASKGAKAFRRHTTGYTKQDHVDAEAKHGSIREQSRGVRGGDTGGHLESVRAYHGEMQSAHAAAARNKRDNRVGLQGLDVSADRASRHHDAEKKRHADAKQQAKERGDSALPAGMEQHGFSQDKLAELKPQRRELSSKDSYDRFSSAT